MQDSRSFDPINSKWQEEEGGGGEKLACRLR